MCTDFDFVRNLHYAWSLKAHELLSGMAGKCKFDLVQ